ncbi:hypothetical protein L7F22_049156 [Adiantum nelumboides]|nr:hypothetical protein [Adiantum nelumboides]
MLPLMVYRCIVKLIQRNQKPYVLVTVETGKVPRGKLSEVGNSICETTGWSDPVDSLSVYAYIAKSKAHEAMVEQKRKRDEETSKTSKRATRASSRKEERTPPKPIPEVDMEDAPKDKKQGKPRGPSYKLKSNIELPTDLKKVFEEHILNGKVEMTLGDILGIAKCEFHEEIIGIIKRKQQIPSNLEPQAIKIQEHSSYTLILGQPYITAVRMETKVLDDGSPMQEFKARMISYVDMMSELEEIRRNRLQNEPKVVNIASMDAYEMLL